MVNFLRVNTTSEDNDGDDDCDGGGGGVEGSCGLCLLQVGAECRRQKKYYQRDLIYSL